MHGSLYDSTIWHDESVEPSSTISNSKSANVCSNTLSMLSHRYFSELYMDMQTDTLGMAVRLLLLMFFKHYIRVEIAEKMGGNQKIIRFPPIFLQILFL